MRFLPPVSVFLVVSAIAVAALFNSSSWATTSSAPDTDNGQRAVWTPKEVHFAFMGFTTRYSCQGLKDKVRKALLELGARKDLRVEQGACRSPAAGPELFPNVNVKMNVLQPLTGDKAAVNAVPAHWRKIELELHRDPLSQAEDCELLEQIEHTFLPLFTTRNVDYHLTCAAHQVFQNGTWLRADVLAADQKPDAKSVAAK